MSAEESSMDKNIPRRMYLVDLYEGKVEMTCDGADELVAYLKSKKESSQLRDEAAYYVFWGHHLSTKRFWESAFGKKEEPSQKKVYVCLSRCSFFHSWDECGHNSFDDKDDYVKSGDYPICPLYDGKT